MMTLNILFGKDNYLSILAQHMLTQGTKLM
jgi:hypothetical protein